MIYVFTNKPAPLKTVFPKNTAFGSLPFSKHSPGDGDITYIDISGLTGPELKKMLIQIKKQCKDTPWGIIDTKGTKDPAALFFEGAWDYLGPALLKSSGGLEAKRLKEALLWRRAFAGSGKENGKSKETASFLDSGVQLPAVKAFPGWNKMEAGKVMPFYLLYCTLQGKIALDVRLGEKVLAQVNARFQSYLAGLFKEIGGLLWMKTTNDCLFLIPPKVECAETVVRECMEMAIASPLVVLETLGVTIPVNFIFALHYGSVAYKPPGKTGTVVSDAVNAVFHLGAKKAEPGCLTVSDALPDVSIPKRAQDLFVPCGEFEGRKIWQTKKFGYLKTWV